MVKLRETPQWKLSKLKRIRERLYVDIREINQIISELEIEIETSKQEREEEEK